MTDKWANEAWNAVKDVGMELCQSRNGLDAIKTALEKAYNKGLKDAKAKNAENGFYWVKLDDNQENIISSKYNEIWYICGTDEEISFKDIEIVEGPLQPPVK